MKLELNIYTVFSSSIVGVPDDQSSSSNDWRQKMQFEPSTVSTAKLVATPSLSRDDQLHQRIEKHVQEKMVTSEPSLPIPGGDSDEVLLYSGTCMCIGYNPLVTGYRNRGEGGS